MGVSGVGSGSGSPVQIGNTNLGTASGSPVQGPQPSLSLQQNVVDERAPNLLRNYGISAVPLAYLPATDDSRSALTFDVHRIISEAQEERREEVKERMLNAAARIEDMIAQYNAAMERFYESRQLAQMAAAEAAQSQSYAADASAAANEALGLAQQMGELAPDCGASAAEVEQLAVTAAAQAEAAAAQADTLSQAVEPGAGAEGDIVLVDDARESLEVESSPVEYATSLAAQLTSATFVPANEGAAQLAATSLTQIVAAYNETTAPQLDAPLGYWTNLAEQELAAGTWLDAAPTATVDIAASPVSATVQDPAAASAPAAASGPAAASSIANTGTNTAAAGPVALQGNAFWAIGDAGAVGTETIAGQAITPGEYIADKPLVFVTQTVDQVQYVEQGESTQSITVQVEQQVAITLGDAARQMNLDADQAATYFAEHGAYLVGEGAIGTRAEFEAAHGRAPGVEDIAFLLTPASTLVGENGAELAPATYGNVEQHLEAVGHDIGVYEWLPPDVIAAAQASTTGHVLLASSDQITTVQAHLDEQSLVYLEQTVTEYVGDGSELGYQPVEVVRQVAVPTFQAAATLGLSGAELTAYAEANRAYVLSDGTVGTRAQFEALEKRPPSEGDRAYIVASPTQQGGENESSTAAVIGTQNAYLAVIGLSASTPRDLTISFNNSYSGGGDAYLDTSHRTFDLTQPNTSPSRAYHAVANDALAGEWVQIGDKGPIGDDVAKLLNDVYGEFGADTPEKQEIVRSMLFRYDPNYGVIANRDLIEGAVEMNNARRQGFFERGVGRAIISVVATIIGGPALAAGVAAAFTAADGGSFADIVRAGAAAYVGGVVGANVGGAVAGSLATSSLSATAIAGISGFAQGVSSSFTSQLIGTGRIDADALLAAGISGGVGGAVTTAISGTELVANIDRALGLNPGTTARIIGSQAGSVASTGELSLEGALLALGNGVVNTDGSIKGPPPADAEISEYQARGYTADEAYVLRSMGFSPSVLPEIHGAEVGPVEDASVVPSARKGAAVANVFNTLSGNPNIKVEMRTTPQGGQTIDIWTREGAQVTYRFMNGELMGTQTNLDLVASGIGPRMGQVSGMVDELRSNPNLTVNASTNYRTGVQQILITSSGQPPVQYNYENGLFVSVTYPNQVATTEFMVNNAQSTYGVPADIARFWANRAITGQSLIAANTPPDVVAMGQLATVAIHVGEAGGASRDNGSGVLAVANINGVDTAVLITATHVVNPGANTVLSARDSMGRVVQIPFDGQTTLTSGVVDANNRVGMGATAAGDGFLVTLSPETLNALRPGVSLANLPRVGPPPADGTPIYQFGYAAWGNVNAAGQYAGTNLVGAAGSATSSGNGVVTTGMAASTTNPPATGGMSGGPAFVQLPNGTIQVIGVAQGHGPANRLALVNNFLGTNFTSHNSVFASLYWLLYRGGSGP